MGRLKDKVAVITGAGSGIGKNIALTYAKEGAKLLLADINVNAVEETAKEANALGADAIALQTNVTLEKDIQNMIDTAIDKYGTVDVLVNNAGIVDNMFAAANVPDEVWDRVLAINTTAFMRSIRKILPIFEKKGGGTIVNMASISGVTGGRGGFAYTASKHAVVGMTKNVAAHYGHLGIRCNAIAPGGIPTELAKSLTNPDPFGMAQAIAYNNEKLRVGTTQDIANIALFLGSDDSLVVNGAIIVSDAGWSAY